MKKRTFIIPLLFTAVFTGQNAFALDLEEVRPQGISSTGKSLIINRGSLEDYTEGQFARFYLQKGPKEYPKVFLVAEGELVKTFPRKSYWMLKKIYIPGAISEKSPLLILTSGKLLSGRNLKLRNHHVVMPEKGYSGVDDYIDQNRENVPARLVKEDKGYDASPNVFKTEEIKDTTPDIDVLVSTYEDVKTKPGNYYSEEYGDLTGQKYFVGNQQVALGDIKKAEDKLLFDSMNDGYVKKVNGMKYGLKAFYRQGEKTPGMPEIRTDGTMLNTYDQIREDQKEKPVVEPRAITKFNRDGDQWSSDMDDKTLRRYFIQTGMEKEAKRRHLALSELEGHEIMFSYSGGLIAHGNTNDPDYQGRGYMLSLAYDFHLSRISPEYKQWSVQVLLERGETQYSLGNYNARAKELSYGAYVNYYFVNNPLTLSSFIYSVGLGIKNGSADVYTSSITRDYSYQVLSLPALQLMGKYRFRTGDLTEDNVNVGASWNFGVGLDLKNLSVGEQMDDDINSKFSVNDLKYTLGMSIYF